MPTQIILLLRGAQRRREIERRTAPDCDCRLRRFLRLTQLTDTVKSFLSLIRVLRDCRRRLCVRRAAMTISSGRPMAICRRSGNGSASSFRSTRRWRKRSRRTTLIWREVLMAVHLWIFGACRISSIVCLEHGEHMGVWMVHYLLARVHVDFRLL